MKNIILVILLSLNFSSLVSQRYYDSNDLKYYLDFTNNSANLRFEDYKISGPIEEIESFYRNKFTLIKGDSIHWMLGQSDDNNNRHLSYLIIKGEYKDLRKLARREASSKKLKILKSDKINSGYFRDYINFVSENKYEKINKDRQIGLYINDAGFTGKYNIKIYRSDNINYKDLDIKGVIEITKKDINVKTNLPTLTSFTGEYDSELNSDLSFINRGIISGRGKNNDLSIFTLYLNLNELSGSISIISVQISDNELKLNKRETTTFAINEIN